MLRRLALLGAALVGIPACEDEEDPFEAADIYFLDTFDAPGIEKWNSSGAAAMEVAVGAPAPSLALGRGGRAWTRAEFFGQDMRVNVSVAPGEGVAGVEIVATSGETLASAEVGADRAVVRAAGLSATAPLPAGTAFRGLSFRVNEVGSASWLIDNVTLLSAEGMPATMVFVRLSHLAGPTVFFDNVIVSGN